MYFSRSFASLQLSSHSVSNGLSNKLSPLELEDHPLSSTPSSRPQTSVDPLQAALYQLPNMVREEGEDERIYEAVSRATSRTSRSSVQSIGTGPAVCNDLIVEDMDVV